MSSRLVTCSILFIILIGTLQVAGDYISCTHSNEMLLIAHISQIAKNISAARDRCWTTVETAIFRGYNSLYQRHIRRFSQAMSKSELCIGHDVPDFEFTSTVKGPGGQKIDMKFLNSFQWFSKYLLYSSSQQSVSNLQGIWADGPTSAWNGDYHFNINLQMTYWPIYSMGIAKELILPLSRFITQIASSGGNTARELYSCQGWVAHAFTDGSLDTRILGDLEWSLCVTCML